MLKELLKNNWVQINFKDKNNNFFKGTGSFELIDDGFSKQIVINFEEDDDCLLKELRIKEW